MIEIFVKAWDKNKSLLEEHIKKQNQEDLDYVLLLKWLIDIVINPYIDEADSFIQKFDSDKIHVIDDGNYQGSQLFIVPTNIYQPELKDYIWTYQDYGSCSGCDLLESIREYDEGLPTEKQVKEYMMLELHLLQRCRYMIDRETYIDDIKKEQNENT